MVIAATAEEIRAIRSAGTEQGAKIKGSPIHLFVRRRRRVSLQMNSAARVAGKGHRIAKFIEIWLLVFFVSRFTVNKKALPGNSS